MKYTISSYNELIQIIKVLEKVKPGDIIVVDSRAKQELVQRTMSLMLIQDVSVELEDPFRNYLFCYFEGANRK